jgi:hypothetical protein
MELMERLKAQAEQARQGVDAYYADILDIPAHRDTRSDNLASTSMQILCLQNPAARVVDDPNSLYVDPSFNNSPYVLNFEESGAPRFTSEGLRRATDTREPSTNVPDANLLELWAGEMRALSEKEMSGAPLSGDEEQLLRQYQEYFGGRTGMAEGGVVLPDEQKGIFGLFTDSMLLTEPPEGAPITKPRQTAIKESAYQDSPYRDQFYAPGAANFAERLMLEYDYPSEFDAEGNREVIDISFDGAQSKALPEGRSDLPMPQELLDARQHMLGTALAARGYGEGIAGFIGNINEDLFGRDQTPADRAMDKRNNAIGLDLFRRAGMEATTQELTEMVDDAIFLQLNQIMARSPGQRNFRSPETGPDLYFPRDARGGIATKQY